MKRMLQYLLLILLLQLHTLYVCAQQTQASGSHTVSDTSRSMARTPSKHFAGPPPHGREMTIVTKSGWEVSGELLSVRPDEILICSTKDLDDTMLAQHNDWIVRIRAAEINKVHADGHSYWVAGMLSGMALGATVANAVAKQGDSYTAGFIGMGTTLGCALIGMFIKSPEIDIQMPDSSALMQLRPESRYAKGEPAFLNALTDKPSESKSASFAVNDTIRTVTRDASEHFAEPGRRGREMTIVTKSGWAMSGELLSVRPEELLVCLKKDLDDTILVNHPDWIVRVRIAEIEKVHADGHSYWFYGLVSGVIVGNLVGHSVAKQGYDDTAMGVDMGVALGGALIGTLMGVLQIDIQQPGTNSLQQLKPKSRYVNGEPEFLRELK